MKQPLSKKSLSSSIIILLLLVFVLAVAYHRQYIYDAYRYYEYQPSSEVASLAESTGMSDQGRFLFYASQPLLQNAEDFRNSCDKKEASSIVLGCYDGHDIYIYNVEDERIKTVRATTAAHEMLHAAYKRLSSKDRAYVDGLLEAEYATLRLDQDMADRVALYERTEPGERLNELHSIIGTEIETISPELEAYYRRYFTDRNRMVSLHKQYESVFTALRKQAEELRRQLNELNQAVGIKTEKYKNEVGEVQAAVDNFNTRARSGAFASQAEFSRERQLLVARSDALEALRLDINSSVDYYNALVAQLNSIATETETLNKSLNGHLAPAPSLEG